MTEFGKKNEPDLLAVIGDISRSREAPDRAAMQVRLEEALAATNRKHGDILAAEFEVTLGDEFQGLLRSPGDAVQVLVDLECAMANLPVRYGLGLGALATALVKRVGRLDGPCFHHARAALLRGKKEDRWVTVRGFGEERDRILNGLFRIMGAARSRWTEKQARTVSKVRRAASQKEAAAELGVVPSVVSEALSAANYIPILEAEAALTALLDEFGKNDELVLYSEKKTN